MSLSDADRKIIDAAHAAISASQEPQRKLQEMSRSYSARSRKVGRAYRQKLWTKLSPPPASAPKTSSAAMPKATAPTRSS